MCGLHSSCWLILRECLKPGRINCALSLRLCVSVSVCPSTAGGPVCDLFFPHQPCAVQCQVSSLAQQPCFLRSAASPRSVSPSRLDTFCQETYPLASDTWVVTHPVLSCLTLASSHLYPASAESPIEKLETEQSAVSITQKTRPFLLHFKVWRQLDVAISDST